MWRLFPILILCFGLWAADPVTTAVDKAQALAVKKNRKEAAQVLNEAIAVASPPLKGRGKLIEVQANIAKVFFTDKGQKLYESAQSSMYENPDVALNQFKEALALEDENLSITDNIARIQLGKQDCVGAAATVQKARALFPYAAEPALLELRALICEKNFEGFREKAKTLPPLDKSQEKFLQYLQALDLLQQKVWRKASDLLIKISEDEPQFPETYYLLVRVGTELNLETEPWAQKYISLCKSMTVRERKRFSLESRLCVNAKEVEDELAKKSEL